jgi:VIT1/CCC1 family predicted Fe2+/Mn2+ transporter
MEEEAAISFKGTGMKREVYKLIDKSLFVSFLGGVLLGIVPFLFLSDLYILSIISSVISLALYFSSRYLGLNFLFEGDDDDDEIIK